MSKSSWTDEQTATLAKALSEGKSFSEAASIVNGEHGTSFSRNAAIGCAARRGIKQGEKEHCPRPRKLSAPKPRVVKAPVPLADVKPEPVNVKSKNITLAQLEDRMCKWPTGDDAYCGHPTPDRRKPYCDTHQRAGVMPARYRGIWRQAINR